MSAPLTLEQFAEILAGIEQRRDPLRVLAERGIDPEVWRREKQRIAASLRDEEERARFTRIYADQLDPPAPRSEDPPAPTPPAPRREEPPPVAAVSKELPSYLMKPAEAPPVATLPAAARQAAAPAPLTDETAALPRDEILKQLIAEAEPQAALARAPNAPRVAPAKSSDDALGGETEMISRDEVMKGLLLPFNASPDTAPPVETRELAPVVPKDTRMLRPEELTPLTHWGSSPAPFQTGEALTTVDEYVEVMLGLAEARDPVAFLARYKLTRETWITASRTWADRIRGNPALGKMYDELVGRKRSGGSPGGR